MVVLGGMASINGSIVAATLITVINFMLQKNLSGDAAALKNLIYALILILMILFNNAPIFANIKNKIAPSAIMRRIHDKKAHPGDITDDSADWRVIPTKIKMDEVLSTDLQPNAAFEPDKPGRAHSGKNNGEGGKTDE